MMWKALGWIGEGWSGAETRICKNLEQGIGFSAVDGYCSYGVFQLVFDFSRRDLRVADYYF